MRYSRCKNGHMYNPEENAVCPECSSQKIAGNYSDQAEPTQMMQTCNKGHTYDSKYKRCPYCEKEDNSSGTNLNYTPTREDSSYLSGDALGGKTIMVGPGMYPNAEEKENRINISKDEPRISSSGHETVAISPNDKQHIFKLTSQEIIPVVGWLVCVSGVNTGKDYRIIGARNRMGRNRDFEIFIDNDLTISSKVNFFIIYEYKKNKFYIQISNEMTNNVYLNDEILLENKMLNAFDTIEVGNCKFMFVPLCNDTFRWN